MVLIITCFKFKPENVVSMHEEEYNDEHLTTKNDRPG
jgi:hypothetical protein